MQPKLEDVLLPYVVYILFVPGTSPKIPVRLGYGRILGMRVKDLYELYIRTLTEEK
jgi:hypothetical protein